MDAADPPRAGGPSPRAGTDRGSRGGLPLRPRSGRQAEPRLPASRQSLVAARAARMPGPSRRKGRDGLDQAETRPGAGAGGDSDQGVLLLPPDGLGSCVVVSRCVDFTLAEIIGSGIASAASGRAHIVRTWSWLDCWLQAGRLKTLGNPTRKGFVFMRWQLP